MKQELDDYLALLNGLKRTRGFGLFFAEAATPTAESLAQRLKQDLGQENLLILSLHSALEEGNFIRYLSQEQEASTEAEVILIQGLEHSLRRKMDSLHIPQVLVHLNQQRERLRDTFSQCLVFVLPPFAMTQVICQAPDFFDWRSGYFRFEVEYSPGRTF